MHALPNLRNLATQCCPSPHMSLSCCHSRKAETPRGLFALFQSKQAQLGGDAKPKLMTQPGYLPDQYAVYLRPRKMPRNADVDAAKEFNRRFGGIHVKLCGFAPERGSGSTEAPAHIGKPAQAVQAKPHRPLPTLARLARSTPHTHSAHTLPTARPHPITLASLSPPPSPLYVQLTTTPTLPPPIYNPNLIS
jgi:hypothetical protein